MSLAHAARERRPEGPAYLLSSVVLLYLAGQCAFLCTNCGRILSVAPEFEIRDLSPLAVASPSEREAAVIVIEA